MKNKLAVLGATGVAVFASFQAWANQNAKIISHEVIARNSRILPVPPSFAGHPWVFSVAICGQLMAFSVAAALTYLIAPGIDFKRDRIYREGGWTWQSPVTLYRLSILAFMTGILMATSTNLMVYLAWGEVRASTMGTLYVIDKVAKGTLCIPFVIGAFLVLKNDEAVALSLSLTKVWSKDVWPEPPNLKRYVWMMSLVFLLAIGVTYAKWQAVRG